MMLLVSQRRKGGARFSFRFPVPPAVVDRDVCVMPELSNFCPRLYLYVGQSRTFWNKKPWRLWSCQYVVGTKIRFLDAHGTPIATSVPHCLSHACLSRTIFGPFIEANIIWRHQWTSVFCMGVGLVWNPLHCFMLFFLCCETQLRC